LEVFLTGVFIVVDFLTTFFVVLVALELFFDLLGAFFKGTFVFGFILFAVAIN
tara:strand:- start:165 stop:323 length:159 start_codon:yes stop_codon:yes gene_type:complete